LSAVGFAEAEDPVDPAQPAIDNATATTAIRVRGALGKIRTSVSLL
jgi:hypothetical protein